MKKILVAFDATNFDKDALTYAIHYAKQSNGLLVGVLLHDLRYSNYVYGYSWDQPVVDYVSIEKAERTDKHKIKHTIAEFKNICAENGVHHKIHIDRGVPIETLLHETAFADFLVISSHLSFSPIGESELGMFMKEVLHDSYCPVLVVPNNWHIVQKNILCYDGSISSMNAIKMFSYIFTNNIDLPTTILTVNETTGNHLADNGNVKDWLNRHFSNLQTEILHGQPEHEIIKYLKKNGQNAMIVMGAYGRSSLSRLFHHSISNPIIKDLKLPLFISHK